MRKKGKVQYTPAPNQEQPRAQVPSGPQGPPEEDHNISTEDQEFMDTSNVLQTEAGFDPELNPESGSSSDSELSKSNGSEEEELNRRRGQDEGTEDIRDFTPQFIPPKLPSGEWYMPNLNNTPLSAVMKFGSFFDATGRMLFQFRKLEQYTNHDMYVINPHTGQIDIWDGDKKCYLSF